MFGILGASGFIGRSMVTHFTNAPRAYRAFVRPSSSFTNDGKAMSFDLNHPDDLSVFDGVETLLLAGWSTKPSSPNNSYENEIHTNVLPQINFLKRLLGTDVKHLIFLSSGGAVYGPSEPNISLSEDMICKPVTPYGYGKLCVENAIHAIWAAQGRRFTIIRPSNPVGPHQMLSVGVHGLFPSVINAMVRREPIVIYGDGTTVRDYFSVDDLARLILDVTDRDMGNQLVNAGSGQGLSINDVITLCAKATQETPILDCRTAMQPAISHNVLDISHATSLYGWRPEISINSVAQDLVKTLRTAL